MQNPSITAILVAYNSAGVIGRALGSLRHPAIASVIVVDNCSSDDTCDMIRRDFPWVTLVENPKNDGYGRGNNVGLNKVKTDYALLVNPDAVMKEGAIDALAAAAARYTDAGILAPQLVDEQGDVDHSYKRNVFAREKSRDTYVAPSGDLSAEFLSGAVWLMNMKMMKQIGFFDKEIFLYYEDDDMCLRTRKAGFGLVLVHDAQALHLKGASSGPPKLEAERFRQKCMTWSRLYIEMKYNGQPAAGKLAGKLHLEYSLKAAWYTLKCDKVKLERYRGRLDGLFEFSEANLQSKAA